MKKVEDISVTIDNKGTYDNIGLLNFDHDQGAWVFWPKAIDDGVTYHSDLNETLKDITLEYGASVYALALQHGNAVIITPAGVAAGVDSELDISGFTIVGI